MEGSLFKLNKKNLKNERTRERKRKKIKTSILEMNVGSMIKKNFHNLFENHCKQLCEEQSVDSKEKKGQNKSHNHHIKTIKQKQK